MTKIILILAIAIAGLGIPSAFACEEGDIQFWSNLLGSPNIEIQHNTEPSIIGGGGFLLPLPTMVPEIIVASNLNQLVADRLNALGYFVDDGGVRTVESADVNFALDGTQSASAGFSTICKNGVMQVIGGMLLQPDTATLVLAYGIANAIWLVPSVAGIGIAVYLTRNRLLKH